MVLPMETRGDLGALPTGPGLMCLMWACRRPHKGGPWRYMCPPAYVAGQPSSIPFQLQKLPLRSSSPPPQYGRVCQFAPPNLDHGACFLSCTLQPAMPVTSMFPSPDRRPGILVLINDADWELLVSAGGPPCLPSLLPPAPQPTERNGAWGGLLSFILGTVVEGDQRVPECLFLGRASWTTSYRTGTASSSSPHSTEARPLGAPSPAALQPLGPASPRCFLAALSPKLPLGRKKRPGAKNEPSRGT